MTDNSEAWSALAAAARSGDPVATQSLALELVVHRGMRLRPEPRSSYSHATSVSQGVALVLGTLAAQQPDSDLGALARAVLDEVVR